MDGALPDRSPPAGARPAVERGYARLPAPRCFPARRLNRRLALFLAGGLAQLVPLAPPAAEARDVAPAAVDASALREEIDDRAGSDLRPFYRQRADRPLWFDASGHVSPAALLLLRQVQSARLDGIRPGKLKADVLAKALERSRDGGTEEIAQAEVQLSKSYVAWVKALRAAKRADMVYESDALKPMVPTTTAALEAAAAAPSLERHVATMGWMHPLYAPVRTALANPLLDAGRRQVLSRNLERIRALPAIPRGRYVLVDAASARLWMVEDGRPAGSMRVVVGKPDQQTPMMAGYLSTAILNPYWNVPGDLVRDRIAVNVLARGFGYLEAGGYQVLADWSGHPATVDPRTVDWHAIAAGAPPPRVRQLPGGVNFMGRVKFMFPNALGIYLHDTPDKHLMREPARQLSSGCVRLEDAARFGRWLLRKPLPRSGREPERQVALAEPVPLFITYLTAMPGPDGLAFLPDVYGRDPGGAAKTPALAQAR